MKNSLDSWVHQLKVASGLLVMLSLTGARADDVLQHQVAQTGAISLGTSGGNVNDISTLYCCSGTLGSLVQDGNNVQYILSNNHVLGKANFGVEGDPISQPGLIDYNCGVNRVVANLTKIVPLQFKNGKTVPLNQVDAAMAGVVNGAVRADGNIIGIGGISSVTLGSPVLGQRVQKSGRTTGLTLGTISAVGVTVDVGYSATCGGASKYVARFVNQIQVSDGSFSAGGDSGSLIVESGTADSDGLPRAVGLLFAGSSSSTLANPIGPVLSQLGAASGTTITLVKGTPPAPALGSVAGVVQSTSGTPLAGATVTADSGQSATTLGDGSYQLGNVPAGSRTVTASAAGYNSNSQTVQVDSGATANQNFTLSAVVGPTKSLIQCVAYQTTGARNRNLQITVSVVDDLGKPLDGASVSISVKRNGALYGTSTGTTSGGQVAFTASNAPDGTYVTTVTGIVKAGLAFVDSTPANSFVKGGADTSAQFCNSASSGITSADEPGDAGSKRRANIARVQTIKDRHSDELFNVDDVIGHGISQNADGELVIEVYLAKENSNSRRVIPAALEGVSMRVIVTGPFEAY